MLCVDALTTRISDASFAELQMCVCVCVCVIALAETWCTGLAARGRHIGAENFWPSPKMRFFFLGGEGRLGTQALGTKCWLGVTVYRRCIWYHMFYHFTPDLGLILVESG